MILQSATTLQFPFNILLFKTCIYHIIFINTLLVVCGIDEILICDDDEMEISVYNLIFAFGVVGTMVLNMLLINICSESDDDGGIVVFMDLDIRLTFDWINVFG
jgi:hypothetical protein